MTTVYKLPGNYRLNVVRVDGESVTCSMYDPQGVFVRYQDATKLELTLLVDGKLIEPVN